MNISQLLKQRLIDNKMSIAVAESLTGGHLQAMITSVSGSSEYFQGGVTAYHISQKVNLLGVNHDHANSVNCVSQQVAYEMAVGVRKMFNSDIGLATTGYAESWPDGGIDKPFAWIAIDINGEIHTEMIEPTVFQRVAVQKLIAETILSRLVAKLQ